MAERNYKLEKIYYAALSRAVETGKAVRFHFDRQRGWWIYPWMWEAIHGRAGEK